MSNNPMTIEALREMLDAYGGDPDRWPVRDRDAAEALIARDPQAAAMQADAAALDAMLNQMVAPEDVSEDTRQAILAVPQHVRQDKPARSWSFGLDLGFLLPRLAGITAAGILGFYIGFADLVTIPGDAASTPYYDLTGLVFDDYAEEALL